MKVGESESAIISSVCRIEYIREQNHPICRSHGAVWGNKGGLEEMLKDLNRLTQGVQYGGKSRETQTYGQRKHLRVAKAYLK